MRAQEVVQQIYIDDKVKEYVIDLVFASRDPQSFKLDLAPFIEYGASPRASIYLAQAARAHAFVNGRGYVEPDDVKAVAVDVLRHRLVVTYEAEAENVSAEEIVRRVLTGVDIP